MKNAAMTRIFRCEIFLEMWLKYYSRYFEDLFVFAGTYNGNAPGTFEALKEKYPFTYIDLKDEFYNMNSHQKVFEKQRELLVDHEWVLYSDSDEIIVADPEKYDGLRHFMSKCDLAQTYCEGFEVYQEDDENPILYDQPILMQRKWWCKDDTASYNKPALSRIPTDWGEGFHYIKGHEQDVKDVKDTGLYLLHLKYLDPMREFDYPRHHTGTHGDIGRYKVNRQPIPEKIRKLL